MDLKSLNGKFQAIGLPGLTKLGSSSNGEIVVNDVMPSVTVVQGLFTVATLLVTDPKTLLQKTHLLMHDHKEACILVVLVNDEYLITVRQHRLPEMRFLEELPRGWLSHEGPGSEPFQILEREVPNLQKLTKVVQVIDRGKFALDTSWRTGKTRIQIVRVETDPAELANGPEEFQAKLRLGAGKVIKPVVRRLEEVKTQVRAIMRGENQQDWLQDMHSHAAVLSLLDFLREENSEK